jgi:hypothetical protein
LVTTRCNAKARHTICIGNNDVARLNMHLANANSFIDTADLNSVFAGVLYGAIS